MPRIKPTDEQLRAQIEAVTAEKFPSDQIEARIASALTSDGRFEARLNSDELSAVLRQLVYTMFSKHTLLGQGVNLVHNVATMRVVMNESEAKIGFIVHIHKPIIAFLKFKYCLVNDPVSVDRKLRLKRDSLVVRQHTRRFDIKAKAALAAINIEKIARQELSNPSRIIRATLPDQLEKHGLCGSFTRIEMALKDHYLELRLEGDFEPLADKTSSDGDG
ncbi:MAG: hypothetical protein JSW55_04670 [Chloroflexota bacterium]|nr:MAG: hypothetical protein JSW55_04670 [Chloroflexota bacterium]